MATNHRGQRRVVLTEEEYTSKLEGIVARDFFPDVQKLEKQNELLDRRMEGDVAGAIAVRRATRKMIQQEEADAERRAQEDRDVIGEASTALAVASNTTLQPIRKRPRPLHDESLTGFVARATNEDDHEFDSNLKRDLKANRERISEYYSMNHKKNNTESNRPNLHLEMASDDFAAESNRIEWKKPTERNGLFFNPTPINPPSQNYHGTIDPETKLIKGPVGESSVANPEEDQSLMPPPSKQQTSAIVATHKAERQNAARLPKSELVEYIPKDNLQTKIQPSATRFPTKVLSTTIIGINNNSNNGITGEEIDSASDTDYMSEVSTDLDAPLRSVEEERKRYKSQKQSRPYVTMTPQIIPGAGNESPITTWGTIDGTPLVLSGSTNTSEPSFRMPKTSERESAANKAETLMAKRTKLASSTAKTKTKKRRDTAKSSLTPAALSLLEKTKRSQSKSAFVSSLRTSYTPRPSSLVSRNKHSTSKTRRRDHAYNATPQT